MKFSFSMLKQFLKTEATATEIADKLVEMGLEVEGIEDESSTFNRVVVGRIETRVQHPDADKLGVCTVHVGEDEPRTIVCGAPNARDNLTVAVALDGAVLPGDFVIKPTKMRGVKSDGMICSERELGLGEEHNGIWEVDTDAPAGTPIANILGKSDLIFDVSITPNRGDALSLHGIARDLAAGGIGTFVNALPTRSNVQTATDSAVEIKHEGCPFFSLTKIEGVKNADSSMEIQNELTKAGLRSINAIADATNYLLLAYGQPMHAYDADKVKGNIYVAPAKGGETLEGLDGNTHTLAEGDIAIMDDSGVIGLAGIVGGESTSVDENTTSVYLEVAQFDKDSIAKTGQRLQCNTDARYRFERGIDPSATVLVADFAAKWIANVCGGTVSTTQVSGTELPEQRQITFDPKRVETFGGLSLSSAEVKEALEALYFTVAENADGTFNVTVPHHCTIMETPEDLVEEVLRLKGLDAVEAVLPKLPDVKIKGADKGRNADRQARRFFASNGFLECINYSFVGEADALLNANEEELLVIDNPLDEIEMSTMRTSLIPSVLRAAAKNIDRSIGYVRLAEVGKTYTASGEKKSAVAVVMGSQAKTWQGQAQKDDVFTVKSVAEACLAEFGMPLDKLQVRAGGSDMFHPGRSGVLALGKNVFATFGEVHPSLMKKLGLKGTALLVEIDLEAVDAMNIKQSKFEMSSYQPSTRDFALLVDEKVAAGDLLSAFKGADRNLVKEVNLFDVYQGENVEEGKKSIALSVTLQAADRTLTDDEITRVTDKAVAAVKKRYNAEIR